MSSSYASMTVSSLSSLLKARRLKPSDRKKASLIRCLEEHDEAKGGGGPGELAPAAPSAPADKKGKGRAKKGKAEAAPGPAPAPEPEPEPVQEEPAPAAAAPPAAAPAFKPSSSKPAHSTYLPPVYHQPGTFLHAPDIKKGQNVSGRSWKMRPQKRTSTLVTKVKSNNRSTTWEEKEAARLRKRAVQGKEKEMREATRLGKVEKRERALEQEKRRQANEYKATTMQALNLEKVGQKLRTMSKKQLRMVKKTRVNSKTGQVELVDAFAK
jgi:hypothetical protein